MLRQLFKNETGSRVIHVWPRASILYVLYCPPFPSLKMRCVGDISPGREGRLQLTCNMSISSSSGGKAEPSEGSTGEEERSVKWTWLPEADQHLSYQDGGREHVTFSWWHLSLFIFTWHALPWHVFSSFSIFTDAPPQIRFFLLPKMHQIPTMCAWCVLYLSPFSSDLRSLQHLPVPTSCLLCYEGNPFSPSVSIGGSLFSLSKVHLEYLEEVSRSVIITTQDGIPGVGWGSSFVPIGRRDVPAAKTSCLNSLSKQEHSYLKHI